MDPPIAIDDDDDGGHPAHPPPRYVRDRAQDRAQARDHPYARGGRNQRQRPMLSHQTIQDIMNYVEHRPANTVIRDEANMTLAELYSISTILQSLEAIMDVPATISDFKRLLGSIFNRWDSSTPIDAAASLPQRQFGHTRIRVGVLSVDHPLSPQQIKAGVTEQKRERRAGQPVFFGLVLNYETGVVDWAWRDVKNACISPQYVRLDDGQTNVTIRAQAMCQYDTIECNRIRTFNTSLITTCARRIIGKWAQVGTDRDPIIHDMDRPFGLQPLELSGPTVIAESARLAQAGQLYTASFQTQHTLFR